MSQIPLPLAQPATRPRRGRPPGAKSKRSLDLARWVEATYAGMTPGQQAAQLAMVTPAEVRGAKARAKEMRILDHGLSPMMLAMVVKAKLLAAALGCDGRDAWLLLQKEREGLMPYVHQKRAPEAPEKGKEVARMFMVPDGPDNGLAEFSDQGDADAIEFVEHSQTPAD